MSEIVYLKGEFIAKEDAKISPDDRGFIFADGVYEVAKYYNGKAFRYDDHIERLERSLAELSIDFKGTDKLQKIFSQLLSKNNLNKTHAGVYVQISRGEHKRIHNFPGEIKSTIYAFAFELPSNEEHLKNGIKVITSEDIRWQR